MLKFVQIVAICVLSQLGLAQAQDTQISVLLGQPTQIPLKIKVASDTTRCNLEVAIPGQNKFEREVSAPDFQTILSCSYLLLLQPLLQAYAYPRHW